MIKIYSKMPVLGSKNVPVDKVSSECHVTWRNPLTDFGFFLDKFTVDSREREDQGVLIQSERKCGRHRAVRVRQLAARMGRGVGK